MTPSHLLIENDDAPAHARRTGTARADPLSGDAIAQIVAYRRGSSLGAVVALGAVFAGLSSNRATDFSTRSI